MPPVAATSLEAKAVKSVRDLIAASPTFIARQTAYAPEGTDPLDRVYIYEADDMTLGVDLRTLRPFAVVGLSEDAAYRAVSNCSVVDLEASLGVYVVFVDNARFADVGGADVQSDSYLDFLNFMGGVLADMSGAFGGPLDLVGFNGIETVESLSRSPINERQSDDYFAVVLKFKFERGE